MNKHSELELNSTSNFCLTGRALGSEHGSQDYSGMLNLSGARIVKETWLLSLVAQRDELLKALEKLASVAEGCEQIASSYSGSIDGVEEHGGDDHEDPSCAIFHRLYYAMFDAKAAIAKAKDGAA